MQQPVAGVGRRQVGGPRRPAGRVTKDDLTRRFDDGSVGSIRDQTFQRAGDGGSFYPATARPFRRESAAQALLYLGTYPRQ